MAAPRTTHSLRVRSYEIRPGGRVGSASFLNWFQEAAFANSTELGYGVERYVELGISWVMRQSDLQILERPRYNEQIHLTTWLADMQGVRAYRQYEARRTDGTLLARCNTEWVMLDLQSQRPMRIPAEMLRIFDPAQDYILPAIDWPTVGGAPHTSSHHVAFYEEDELAHVNNAVYLNWIEEGGRQAARAAGQPVPTFDRHLLQYRLPAHQGDTLRLESRFARTELGLAWYHEIWRDDDLLMKARSYSGR